MLFQLNGIQDVSMGTLEVALEVLVLRRYLGIAFSIKNLSLQLIHSCDCACTGREMAQLKTELVYVCQTCPKEEKI